MDDPVGALIGTILLGLGTLILYGAFANRKIFGAGGILETTLTTGSLTNLDQIPRAYEIRGTPTDDAEVKAEWQIPIATENAIKNIAASDSALGTQINDEVHKMDSNSDRAGLMKLAQLLALADGQGHRADTAVIRLYVKALTGESV
jgi:hypothetical protein